MGKGAKDQPRDQQMGCCSQKARKRWAGRRAAQREWQTQLGWSHPRQQGKTVVETATVEVLTELWSAGQSVTSGGHSVTVTSWVE